MPLPSAPELPFGLPVLRSVLRIAHAEALATAADPTGRAKRIRALVADLHQQTQALDLASSEISAPGLVSAALLHDLLRAIFTSFVQSTQPNLLTEWVGQIDTAAGAPLCRVAAEAFIDRYPVSPKPTVPESVRELLLLWIAGQNPALKPYAPLFDDQDLRASTPYLQVVEGVKTQLQSEGPALGTQNDLIELLLAPIRRNPDSLEAQLQWILGTFSEWLPAGLRAQVLLVSDLLKEAFTPRGFGPPETPVLEFDPGIADSEHEAFSADSAWMSDVVMIAKSTYVWLDQLSKTYQRPIHRLDQIPDEALDRLADFGFTGLWLIGLWERSQASADIKQRTGNPEAIASAYSLYDYAVAEDLGGESAYRNLKHRAAARGIRLAADMVPNHVGLYSRWVVENPDRFLSLPQPPYPGYRFDGPDLSQDPNVGIWIEDGYWDQSDAAVVFKRLDRHSGDVRYIYHGNDGSHMPWNDTAQLDYLNPEAREAVIQTIVGVARRFPIIRFDAAMTLARRHIRRLWWPQPGEGGAIPSRAERSISSAQFEQRIPEEFWRQVVDRVAAEAPDTLLLAEAFWMMEGYFVRTLGMHRVYNSAFMNMLKSEENAKYRQTLKNVLAFSPEVLERFVNFQNNPDEDPAVIGFGKGDKYFGIALLMVTMPGLPMFGHGQIEAFAEKYGMEYRRAYWDESPDAEVVARHEREIVPLIKKRHLFSHSREFSMYDVGNPGEVEESVFAFSNRFGDERAVVLYNNAWEQASGWLHTAGPVNRGSADAPALVSRTLSEALALDPSDQVVYAFHDLISGLEYLRTGAALAQRGLYVHLNGYQAQVLLGFEPSPLDRQTAALLTRLDGRGVASIKAEREDLVAEDAICEARQHLPALDPDDPLPDRIATVGAALTDLELPTLKRRHLHGLAAEALGDAWHASLALTVPTWLAALTIDADVEAVLGVNVHEGVRWFNQEQMSLFLDVAQAMFELPAPSGQDAARETPTSAGPAPANTNAAELKAAELKAADAKAADAKAAAEATIVLDFDALRAAAASSDYRLDRFLTHAGLPAPEPKVHPDRAPADAISGDATDGDQGGSR